MRHRAITIALLALVMMTTNTLAEQPRSPAAPPTMPRFEFKLPPDVESRWESNVVYGVYGGAALLMDVYHPEKPNGMGIVHVTGGGWATGLGYDAMQRRRLPHVLMEGLPLVKAEYTVFSVEHRALPTFRYPAPIEDVQRAVRFVRHNAKRFGIDPDRIGAIGGSSGGHLVAMLGVLDGKDSPEGNSPVDRESARVQCVVARAAPSNLLTMKRESGLTSMFLGALLSPWTRPGSIPYNRAIAASPVTHVSADDPPILLLHGDADKMVAVEQSRAFAKVLAEAGLTHELVEVEGAGHMPHYPGAKDPSAPVRAMVRWFATHLPPR